jgi:hypothetical protein
MRRDQNSTSKATVPFLPMLFGAAGLVASVGYELQRSGALPNSFYPLDRFIQHNLDAIAGLSALAALLGVVVGLIILRVRGWSTLVTVGTGFALVVLFWSVFGLSL